VTLPPDGVFAFGTFELDLQTGELRKRGLRLKLQSKPIAVLSLLVRNAGQLVTQEELRKELWASDTFVDFEHSLGVAIWKLRNVLGDDADNPRFIETLPRRGYRFLAPVREAQQEGADAKKVVAVLPFDDLGRPADDYFSDGLAEELITQLGRLNPRRLGVIARNSSLRHRGGEMPVKKIAEELVAGFVVLGTVRRDASRLRITVQLVSAKDEVQLWSGSYDRVAKDVITVQIEIAEQVARSLAIELVPETKTPRPARIPSSLEAYELYLQGRHHWSKRTTPSVLIAIEYFEKAIAADPNYALGYAGMSDCYLVLGLYGESTPAESFGRAKQYAQRALGLDDALAEAHSSLAYCLVQLDWDGRAAEHEHLQAIELNANCAPAHHWYGLTLMQLGRFPESLRSLRRAQELDPFSVAVQAHLGRLSYFSRDFERSLAELQRAVELDPNYGAGRYFLGMTLALCGRNREAIAELETLAETSKHPIPLAGLAFAYAKAGKLSAARQTIDQVESLLPQRRVPPYFLAMAWAGLGKAAEAIPWLDIAFTERSGWMFYLQMDPAFDAVRADRGFADLVERMRLAIDGKRAAAR